MEELCCLAPTVEAGILGEYESKGSRFLSFALPLSALDSRLMALRLEHPKAVHFVYASRAFDGGQVIERSSDDGEPRGSSGPSVLAVLRGYGLVDCAVVVVRYFGGVLLGVGGLVRAYTRATQLALESCAKAGAILPYAPQEERELHIAYKDLRALHYQRKKLGIELCAEEFLHDGVRVCLRGGARELGTLLSALARF